jgi:hypothetical protein
MSEARAWRMLGVALVVGSALAVLVPAMKWGMRPEGTILLGLDMGAAFIALAGAAAYLAGMVLCGLHENARGTSKILKSMGFIVGLVGAVLAVDAIVRAGTGAPSINQIWLGMAGSSLALFGIMAFLAHRVLDRATAAPAPAAEQAKAAGA